MKIEELIKKNDTQNQFQVLIDSYKQIENAWNNKIDLENESKNEFNNIIVAGMGGSAISADLLKSFLGNELRISLQVCRDYSLPYYANENSLVIISSYSGNTEETISCLEEAIRKKCKVITVSTGGKVKTIAQENNMPWIKLQKGFQPRYALGVCFFTLLKILHSLNIIPNQNEVVDKVKKLWKNKGVEYSATENTALTFAEELVGFIPLIYSSTGLEAVGYRLKCQFNENSKLHAYNNVIPELNHNEIIGWETFEDKQLNAKLITILDKEYHPQIIKRFNITRKLAKKSKVEMLTLRSSENDSKVRIMDLIYLGDWITYYLSIIRDFDPSEIDNINQLKQSLA